MQKPPPPTRATSRRNFRKRRLNADANATIHALRRRAFRRPVRARTRARARALRCHH